MTRCNTINIVPHRSYRRLLFKKNHIFIESLILLIIMAFMMYVYLIYGLNEFLVFFNTQLNTHDITSVLVNVDIFGLSYSVVNLQYAYLQPLHKFIWLIVLITSYFIMLKQKLFPYNVIMWVNFFIILTTIFLLYFIFFSAYYPYTLVEFSKLYFTATLGFLFFSGIIIIITFVVTPVNFILKLFVFIFSFAYFMIFSMIRFALTILLATQVSVVFSPIMYFTLYLDFFFFVSIYSYLLYWKAIRVKRKDDLWIW